jgi:flagellar hook-associated protein 2
MTVKTDTEAIKKSLQEFVDAYNELNDLLSKSTKYTEETKTAGVLQGDSATVSLQNTLRMLTQGISGSTGAFTRLSDIGIQMRQGGGLTVDSTKLDKGLANVDDLKALFANKANSMGQGGGIAVNFKEVTDKLLAFDGTLNSKTDSLERTLKSNGAEQDKVNKRATTLEERLYKQYSALDGKMSSLNALNSYVSQMVTTWNKSSS